MYASAMTANEMVQYEITHIGGQLRAVSEGMPAKGQDFKFTDQGMTPREIIEHLCEVYTATLAAANGKEHEWGSYKAPTHDYEPLLKAMWDLRRQATAAVKDANNDKLAETGHDYIVAHDAYHVGQLALIRMHVDPSWDPNSIYSEHIESVV